jgi:hypothetical protein
MRIRSWASIDEALCKYWQDHSFLWKPVLLYRNISIEICPQVYIDFMNLNVAHQKNFPRLNPLIIVFPFVTEICDFRFGWSMLLVPWSHCLWLTWSIHVPFKLTSMVDLLSIKRFLDNYTLFCYHTMIPSDFMPAILINQNHFSHRDKYSVKGTIYGRDYITNMNNPGSSDMVLCAPGSLYAKLWSLVRKTDDYCYCIEVGVSCSVCTD